MQPVWYRCYKCLCLNSWYNWWYGRQFIWGTTSVFDTFHKHHMKISLINFSAEVGREGTLKPIIANERLPEIGNDNEVKLNLAQFECLETLVTNQSLIYIYIYNIQSRLNSGNFCYHSIDNWYCDWLRTGRPRGRSSIPGRIKTFHFPMSCRPALGSTKPPIQWVMGALPRG
jgi:hypothetical protein